MTGSVAMAAVFAVWSFWVLLVVGFARRDLGLKGLAVFILLWLVGRVGLAFLPYSPAQAMFPSWVAILDIALVFTIFKGDVRLT